MKCRNCKHNTMLDDGVQFSWCEVIHDNLDIDEERFCSAFSQATNAERIRAMSDEELAEFLDDVRDDWGCSHYPHGTEDWLDWLKQEAEK